ncbi:hypothetical protein ACFOEZ_20030 [Tianweitania populi]|uniref:Histidine kinase n=1 Tax=Tianweitania populi TaxID=1607949 RepID=A0A8J3DX38_9HYPH|nr:hypothetical protein [Tianweitania populi]GHD21253.1 histidine kinase [Tianweitania populi]
MKILVIDDQPRKYSRFFEKLVSVGHLRDETDIVTCSSDGLLKLKQTHYDLVVLDILLPYRNEDEADFDNSVQLLMEISDGTELIKPGRVVGISADKLAAEKASPLFAQYLWTIIEYDSSSDDWINQLTSCISYMSAQGSNPGKPSSKIDLAIICALAEPELSEILSLNWGFGSAEPIDDVTFGHRGQLVSNGRSLSVMAFSVDRMGMVPSSLKAARIIEKLRPKVLAMTGICAGVKDRVDLGDVVLADPCWDWQAGKYAKVSDQSRFLMSPYPFHPPRAVRTFMEQLKADRSALAEIGANAPHKAIGIPKLHLAPLASGSAVVADSEITAEIVDQNRETCGIDMEAYGIYSAAYHSDTPTPLTFVVKGVCDFADPHKNDRYQRDAAYASASVLRVLFERYGDKVVESAD